jgi:hypothetical protein
VVALVEEGDDFDGTAAAPAWLKGGDVRWEVATGELQLGLGVVACEGSSARGWHCGEGHSGGRRHHLAGARRHLEQAIRGVRRGGIAGTGARTATGGRAMEESLGARDGYRGGAQESKYVLRKRPKCRFRVGGKMSH